ncbi:MAG: hypothetical protein HYS17_10425 [Micavibrio aeruginosavorus]|uniref:Uncharacterized protein n=1 Tax=Micavibrio aeruginosavorus TaxID=349221 RepID=A0A7T5R1N6_9BACT|nr:MAG: hypothetical protein HYS17_10425 [Micavibrio aeruginosavorus]
MSDSGFSQFPTKPPPQAGQNLLSLKAGLKAQVLEISGKIARLDAPQTVSGEVAKVNRDGTVQVKTEQGELTIKPRERIIPAEGQKLQIDLPAGAPPKQVTLRPAPPAMPSLPQIPSPNAPPPLPRPENAASAPASIQTPPAGTFPARPALDPHVQAHLNQHLATRPTPAATAPALVSTPPILSEGALIRLTPLSPPQVKEFLTQAVPAVIHPLSTRLAAQATPQTDALFQELPQESIRTLTTTPKETLQSIARHLNEVIRTGGFPITTLPEIQIAFPSAAQMPELILRTFSPAGISQSPPGQAVARPLPFMDMSPVMTGKLLPGETIPLIRISLQPPLLTTPTADSGVFIMFKTSPPLTTQPLTGGISPVSTRLPQSLDMRVQTIHPPVTALITPLPAPESLKISNLGLTATPVATLPQMELITRPAAATQTTVQIIGMTARQIPVIMMPLPQTGDVQFFTIPVMASNLNPGTILTLTPQPGASLAISQSISSDPPGVFELMSGFRWPVFDELAEIQNLQIQATTVHSLAQILPSPAQPAKLPAAALLFIAAVRAGDIQAWLGDKTVDQLRRGGKAEWVARMSREFSGLNKLASEPVNAEWRGMSIPLYAQGQIDKIHLYYRSSDHGSDRDQEQKNKGGSTRFIFDLNLSAIGPVQLDGYVRNKTLDLAVRTEQPFSAAMRHNMTRRYIHVLEAAGLEGTLIFQSHPDKWVHITPRTDLLSTSI